MNNYDDIQTETDLIAGTHLASLDSLEAHLEHIIENMDIDIITLLGLWDDESGEPDSTLANAFRILYETNAEVSIGDGQSIPAVRFVEAYMRQMFNTVLKQHLAMQTIKDFFINSDIPNDTTVDDVRLFILSALLGHCHEKGVIDRLTQTENRRRE